MAKADSAHTTGASSLSPEATVTRPVSELPIYLTPLGYSSQRPAVDLPPIDRRALMQNAHAIARKARPHFAIYREALAYGLRAAWQQVAVTRRAQMLTAQIERRPLTITQLAASRAATRRCGSSFKGA